MKTVVLYSRPGCHLCEDAKAVLDLVRTRHPFVFEERNIDQDDALLRTYLERIPVVTIDGVEAFELFVDRAAFERELGSASASAPSGRSHPDQ
jgi:glutaredoxin